MEYKNAFYVVLKIYFVYYRHIELIMMTLMIIEILIFGVNNVNGGALIKRTLINILKKCMRENDPILQLQVSNPIAVKLSLILSSTLLTY